MIRIAIIRLFVLLAGSMSAPAIAQDAASLYKEAELFEKAFKDDEALKKYVEVLKFQPNDINAICKVSELYSLIGKRQPTKEKQKEYYHQGKDYALRALKINPNFSEANFAMAISMGRIAQMASGEEKIKAVKEIRTYADKCVKQDPTNYKGYHVLGKWYYEISDLSSVERWLVKMMYGSFPKATYEDAIRYYERSRQLNPAFLLNYLELAKVYKRKDDTAKSRALINQMLLLPLVSSDDAKIKTLGRKFLAEL